MSVPPDRSGGAVIVRLGDRTLSGGELRRELGGFELDGVSAAFFGPTGTEYDLPFAEVDAALIGIELDDFIRAVADGRQPEVDGPGGLLAVAAVWAVAESRGRGGSVRIADVADGTSLGRAGSRRRGHRPSTEREADLDMTSSGESSALLAPDFKQIALVVRDLDEAVRRWTRRAGHRPWTAYRLDPTRLKEMRYHERGRRVLVPPRARLAGRGPVRADRSRSAGRASSPTTSTLRGEGLHHVGKFVDDHPAAVAEALARGFTPLQSARGYGAEGDGAFAYFQPPGVAMIVELIEAPRVRIEPEFVYPPNRWLSSASPCASSRSRRSQPAARATCASPPTTAHTASASRRSSAGRPPSQRSCGRSRPICEDSTPSTSSTTGSSLYRALSFRGMAVTGALSAVDQALWDLKGKHFDVPVWQLLGGKARRAVRAMRVVDTGTTERGRRSGTPRRRSRGLYGAEDPALPARPSSDAPGGPARRPGGALRRDPRDGRAGRSTSASSCTAT